ncbi:MAG: HNH endonuclease [Alkalinema sp. RU_4_3]|nr:HNH endonuclease [Alkalinema sp. RU_4_3]
MVSAALRELVAERAQWRCEYCHSPEAISADRFTVEHLLPQSLGGSDSLINLALACRRCNERRSNFMTGIDPETDTVSALFNPRQQKWAHHFKWTSDGLKIVGTSVMGRATCARLDINDEHRPKPFIQTSRRFWVAMNLHPPADDPQD